MYNLQSNVCCNITASNYCFQTTILRNFDCIIMHTNYPNLRHWSVWTCLFRNSPLEYFRTSIVYFAPPSKQDQDHTMTQQSNNGYTVKHIQNHHMLNRIGH